MTTGYWIQRPKWVRTKFWTFLLDQFEEWEKALITERGPSAVIALLDLPCQGGQL